MGSTLGSVGRDEINAFGHLLTDWQNVRSCWDLKVASLPIHERGLAYRSVLNARNFQTPQPFRFWYHPVGSDFGDCVGNREFPVLLTRSVPVSLAKFLGAR